MKNSKTYCFKNKLILNNFNVYDTMQLPDPFSNHFFQTSLQQSLKSPQVSSSFLKKSMRSSSHEKFSQHFQNSSEINNEKPLKKLPSIETSSFFKKSKTPNEKTQKQKERKQFKLEVKSPKISVLRNIDKETDDFMNYLETIHQPEKKMQFRMNNKNKTMHLDLDIFNSKKSESNNFNIFSDLGHRNSMIKNLNTRLFYTKRKSVQLPPNFVPLNENIPFNENITKYKPSKFMHRNDRGSDNPVNFLLTLSNYKDHELLLIDLIKAVLSIKKQENEKFCVRLVSEIVGNCKKLHESLIVTEKMQLFDPLTPRSLFFRLTNNKEFYKLSSIKNFLLNKEKDNKIPTSTPHLDENFIRLLLDYKIRLQEASINYQNEKFEMMKNSIMEEYNSILTKEFVQLQRKKLEGNKKKYDVFKKEIKSRLKMDFVSGRTTLGLSLKKCEANCGELIYVNKIDKVALNDLEKTVFSIQCLHSEIFNSIN